MHLHTVIWGWYSILVLISYMFFKIDITNHTVLGTNSFDEDGFWPFICG